MATKKKVSKVCKKLPPLFKQRLLNALRSGEYEQCTGELYNGYGEYCVMGVVHKLAYPHRDPNGGNISGDDYVREKKIPLVFLGKGGNTSEIQDELIEMNDEGKTFEELADYIEEKL